MRALIQRVSEARVTTGGKVVGEIAKGLLVFVCAMQGDAPAEAEKLAGKVAKLRIFPDDEGKMNRSVLDAGGKALVVSQFTLAADTSRGNRPGFSNAAGPEEGRTLYDHFIEALKGEGVKVRTGVYGADMAVRLINKGPVTIWLDTAAG